MARQDYSKGDVFVPPGAFKAVTDPGQGPANPSVTDVGPTAEVVRYGPAYGDVRRDDGARLMDNPHPRFKSKLKTGHLPENA